MKRLPSGPRGCGLLFLVCGTTCLLVLLNRVIVLSLWGALVPSSFDFPKIQTVVTFVVLIVLIVPEWWLIDWFVDWCRRAIRGLIRSGDAK